jgi:hypothetical protein
MQCLHLTEPLSGLKIFINQFLIDDCSFLSAGNSFNITLFVFQIAYFFFDYSDFMLCYFVCYKVVHCL